ncbi:MAG: hypothetical protein DRI75_04355 [Bacteroidetes bacterium]|nr:MAG: hypothetical protein DRI75_04355 [Bacteroidota bacterium]
MNSEREIIKEYTNGEIIVIWKPKTCIHAAECVHRLPKVYNPDGKPWIKVENASTEELKDQIEACPSGALSYRMNNNKKMKEMENIKVEVLENGPLIVHGTLEIVNANGEKELKENRAAFCRCGVSQNKPYCDGAHKKAEFKG